MITENINFEETFSAIGRNLSEQGYCILENSLPNNIGEELLQYLDLLSSSDFKRAGVGRGTGFVVDNQIRSDKILWITGESSSELKWIYFCNNLKEYLNRNLYLGLSSFESHFARYAKGDFYKRHLDAFKGQGNRIVSVVYYLNKEWIEDDGGELVIYGGDIPESGKRVAPKFGTIIVFLSEEILHEVLSTNTNRLSIAGWFRRTIN